MKNIEYVVLHPFTGEYLSETCRTLAAARSHVAWLREENRLAAEALDRLRIVRITTVDVPLRPKRRGARFARGAP